MKLVPLKRKEAQQFIRDNHRHFPKPPVGDIFRIGLEKDGELIGVIMVGRPVARALDDGRTLEVNRCCVLPDNKNGCSMLYGAAARAGKALGYSRIFTYTLDIESGASMRAVGWKQDAKVKGREWSCPSRPREEQQSLFQTNEKIRWIKDFRGAK